MTVISAFSPAWAAGGGDIQPESRAAPIAREVAGSYLSSQFARASGHIDEAVTHLRRVHGRQPENMAVAVQLQGMLLLQGNMEEAAALAGDIRKADGRDPLSDLVLALRALKHGRRGEAAAILQSARDAGNLQLWVPLLIGWLDQAEGRMTQPLTRDAFRADIGRAAPLVHYHLALINARAGFTAEAAQNFRESIEKPDAAPARIMEKLTSFYYGNGEPPLLAALVAGYEEDRPENRAENTAENTPETTPETTEEENAGAIRTPEEGIAEVLYTMGGVMLGAGVANDAAIYMQLATYLRPGLAEAHVALADAFSELRQYERANAAYDRVPPDSPLYAKSQLHIAVNYDRMGKLKQALALLDRLHRQNPADTDAIVTKGDLYRIHGRYQDAIDAYTEALKRIPSLESADWPILFARGSCLERLGLWPQAEKDLRAALELKPDQPDILNYLGFAQLEHGQNLEGAREMIARAVEARPGDAQIIDSMGWVLYLQGDYEQALAYMEKAVEMLPSDPTVNDHLGDVYWRMGRKTEARFQWNRALSYSPEARLQDAIHRKLKDGLPIPGLASSATP